MSRIIIAAPVGMEKDIANALHYLIEDEGYTILTSDIIAKLMKPIDALKNYNFTELKLILGLTDQINEILSEDDLIYIGQVRKDFKYDHLLVLMPDIVEAQEELIDTQYNYKWLFLCSDQADFKTNSIADILNKIDSIIKEERGNLKLYS